MSERSRRSTAGKRQVSDEYDNDDPWGSRRSSSSRASGTSGSIKAARKSPSGKRRNSNPRSSGKKQKYLKNNQGQKSKAHNPYKDTDFHYGSDFDDVSNDEAEDAVSDVSSELEDEREESDTFEIESDVEIDQLGLAVFEDVPEPFWMRTGEDAIPNLRIPPSSEDLLVSSELALKASGIYEIIRHFLPLLRLSPFLFEEMCAALQDEKQSNLLTEIHISLLKSLLRADEKENTIYGPNDLKDSINSIFFFIDSVTWTEGLRSYLASDPIQNAAPLQIYEEFPEYPLPQTEEDGGKWIEARVKMLTFLTDQFLATTTVRDDISNERPTWPEDHCRVCHRTGDRIVCEQCGGSYHLHCLFPPVYEEPSEDWKCQICIKHEVTGVTDCGYDHEYRLTRHEPLGQDRLGNSYWFVCRRIFVESLDGKVSYYSSKLQLRELIEALDSEEYESELFGNLNENLMMIKKHMETTEALTKVKKPRHSLSYIEAESELIEQAMSELDLKRLGEMERRKALSDQRSNTTLQNGEDKVDFSGDFDHKENGTETEFNEEKQKDISQDDTKPFEDFVLRKTAHESQPDYKFFKLGDDGSYRTYINQYTANPHALTKVQATEERNKRTQMSHKFSLTELSAFKWPGVSPDTRDQLEIALRASLFNLENNVPNIFMHNNWGKAREAWLKAVRESCLTRDFTRALTALVCFMKPCLLLNVWHEALGHTSLKKIVGQLKDDKKKTERRERRDKDIEDERMRPFMGFVKYTLGVKHQVVKQKGEEYRSHGQTGWIWVSNNRKFDPKSMFEVGLRSRTHNVAIHMHNTKTNKRGIVMMKSKDFDACKQEQDKRDLRKAMGLDEDSEPEEENGDDKKPESGPRKKLQLDPSVRIESQDQPAELFKDVINIEQQLSSSARPAYPKIGTCAKFFDKLLEKKQGAVVKTEANGESTDGDKPKSNGGTPSSSNNRLLYPEAPSFNILSDKKSILVLAKHDAKRLARKAGMAQCEGFNYNSKPNPQAWPYPCPRPTFRTSWLYRLASSDSIQSVALHVRILWACLRWDDMQARPILINGKYEVSSESSITTLEVLKTRTSGRFQEKTEYLVRKVIASLDAPKPVKEITPVRAGLRKRRREEMLEEHQSEPTEEWISEDQLELVQIRAFKEKLDPRMQMSKQRPIRATTSSTNTPDSSRASSPATNGKFVKTITQSPQIVYTVKSATGTPTPVTQRTLGVITSSQALVQPNRVNIVTTTSAQKSEPIRVVVPSQRTIPVVGNQSLVTPTVRYVVKGLQSPISNLFRTASSSESLPVVKGTLVKLSDGKIVLKPIENHGAIGQQAVSGTPIQIVSSMTHTNPISGSVISQPSQNTSRLTFSPISLSPKLTPSPLFPTTSGSRINPTISTSLNPGDIVRLQDTKPVLPTPVRLTLNFISNKPLPFKNCTIQASTTVMNNKKLLVLSGLAGHLPPTVQQQIKDAVFRHQGEQIGQGKPQSTKFEIQLTTSISPNPVSLGSSPVNTNSPVSKENSVSIKPPEATLSTVPSTVEVPKPVSVAKAPTPPPTLEEEQLPPEPEVPTSPPPIEEEQLPLEPEVPTSPPPIEEEQFLPEPEVASATEETVDDTVNQENLDDELPQGLMCTCQTEYDPTKHYVGCDTCSQWFHPECVGLTLQQVETMDGFECPPCSQSTAK